MKTETVGTLASAAGASLALGTIAGVPVLGLVFGLAGGIVAPTWAKPMKWWKVILSLVASTLCGGALGRPGWNALILGCYHNGSEFASSFNFDYGQLIFSKATIAAPTA